MYSPQKDKALNVSKNKVRNNAIGSQPNPPKIDLKHTQSKPIVQINFDKKIFGRENLARKC